jgi:biopolymer transport protein ExbB
MRANESRAGRSTLWAALAAVGVHLAVSGAAMAQSGGASAVPDRDFGFFRVWILGGGGLGFIFVLPIEVAAIATAAFVIEHAVTIQRDKLVPPEIVVELETLLDEGRTDEAIGLCEAGRNYLTNIVGAALARSGEGYDAMASAAEAAVDEENLRLQHKITWLPLFGNIGPLMGLFGTVTGMVMAFSQIASSSAPPTPQDLALGIFTALVTTVWGLLVAIPATFFAFLYKVKVQKLSCELSGAALEMVERFRPAAQGS